MFIVFEGGEGVGKTTQVKALFRRLVNLNYTVTLTYEPGGTSLGRSLRRRLKTGTALSAVTELFLFNASRSELVKEVIRPALARNQIVICDRYTASTVAYQGYGRGLPLDLIEQVNRASTEGLEATMTVLLKADPKIGLERKKSGGKDIFESEESTFHEKVQQGYQSLAMADPAKWVVIDASLPMKEVSLLVWKRIEPLLDSVPCN